MICADLPTGPFLTTYRYQNKPLDLSRSIRQTGLSPGAKLELVVASRSPSVVSIALQLTQSDAGSAPGGRLMDKFPSDTTLWLVLRKFESAGGGANLNFTGRAVAQTDGGESGPGRILYETPVLNIMGRELSSFTDLQKTLAQLGLTNGSSLIRLAFRKTDVPLDEAMTDIGNYFKSLEAPEVAAAPQSAALEERKLETKLAEGAVDAAVTEHASTPPMDIDGPVSGAASDTNAIPPSPAEPEISSAGSPQTIVGPQDRPISVFAAPSTSTPRAALLPDDDADYEPSIAHAKLHQTRLLASTQNRRLLSDDEAAAASAAAAAKRSAVTSVSIKIRFPDQLTVVSSFTDKDTSRELYDFVRGVMIPVAEGEPFSLVWMGARGPVTVPKAGEKKLVADLGFRGAMLLSFVWDEGASAEVRKRSVMRDEFVSKAQEVQINAVEPVELSREEADEEAKKDQGKEKDESRGSKPKGGVPKWLKLPGKK